MSLAFPKPLSNLLSGRILIGVGSGVLPGDARAEAGCQAGPSAGTEAGMTLFASVAQVGVLAGLFVRTGSSFGVVTRAVPHWDSLALGGLPRKKLLRAPTFL